MKKLELIIFDMDGLMFDTEKIAFTSWRQAASKRGYDINKELFIKTIGANLERAKEVYLTHFGEEFPIDEIKDERYAIAEDIIKSEGIPVKQGLYDLLHYLNGLQIKKAVATSTSRQRAFSLLKGAGIDTYFDYILCGDEVKNSKPDPEIFLKVADKCGCSPENCIVLEDSEAGISAAHKAGMLPIMIPDMKEPDENIGRLLFKQMATLSDVISFLKNTYEVA